MTPTWVFVRGLMRDARHWGAFPHQFARALGSAEPLLIDLPGNGLRHREPSAASVPAMAQWLRAELRRLGIAPPYRVLAMSLGAMVTVAWAQQAPQEFDAAVLINTSLRPFSRLDERLQPTAWPVALRIALGRLSDAEVESAILKLTSQHREQTRQEIGRAHV
jgi:pimeloyl-ACP methyl ester carboxylesterase